MPYSGNPIIVALDMPSAEEAVRMARLVGPHVGGFKVGLPLLHGPGPGVIGALARLGWVMADAKLHDLPDQVEAAASLLGEYGARWVTAHAAGGHEMLSAAVTGLSDGSGGTGGLLGETVLSSIDAAGLAATGITGGLGRRVARMIRLSLAAGLEGVVCGARELGDAAQVAPDLLRVTPGIRPDGPLEGDGDRVVTPEAALSRGAGLLVVGRPITAASDPAATAEALAARVA